MTIDGPTRLAIFSDIHGNLHALDAVLSAIDELGIRDMVCCGDVVGYGPYPNECCERLRFRRIPTLAGNHDHAAIGLTDITYFNDIAKAAVVWTTERLSVENAEWLKEREYTFRMNDDLFFVHATPDEPEKWGYVLTFRDARSAFEKFEGKFCFIGHSHQPAIVEKTRDELLCPEGMEIDIRDECRYLINVGSVGQPRDRNPLPCFVTLDFEEKKIRFHRVEYEIEHTQAAIREAGLPDELAERIGFGW